jgi:hypothetical protein
MKALCPDSGKIIFESKGDARCALVFIKQSAKHKGIDGRRIKHRCHKVRQRRIYYCSFCKGYHLTSWRWWPFENKKRSFSYFASHELY